MAGKWRERFFGHRKQSEMPLVPTSSPASNVREVVTYPDETSKAWTNTESVHGGFDPHTKYIIVSHPLLRTEISPFVLSVLETPEYYLGMGKFRGHVIGLNAEERAAVFPDKSFNYYQIEDSKRRFRGGWVDVPKQKDVDAPSHIVFEEEFLSLTDLDSLFAHDPSSARLLVKQQVQLQLNTRTGCAESISVHSWIEDRGEEEYYKLGSEQKVFDEPIPYTLQVQEVLSQEVDVKTKCRLVIGDLQLKLPNQIPQIIDVDSPPKEPSPQ